MPRKTLEEYESTRTTVVLSVRVMEEDARLFRERAAIEKEKGVEVGEFFADLLRQRAPSEYQLRDLSRLSAAVSAINEVSLRLRAIRGEVARGFGLVKHTFISAPELAYRAQRELDHATSEARAAIAQAERTIKSVESNLTEPLAEVRAAIQDIRRGQL